MLIKSAGSPLIIDLSAFGQVTKRVGDFIDITATSLLNFSRTTQIRVRGIGAGGYGGSWTGNVTSSGAGGGQGARNETGVLVTASAGLSYQALMSGPGFDTVTGSTIFKLVGSTVYLELRGGETPVIDTGLQGAGGAVITGAGGVTGETGGAANSGSSFYSGAGGGAANYGGDGVDGGTSGLGPGQSGSDPSIAPVRGGAGRGGLPFVLTGAAAGAGHGGGGQGAGDDGAFSLDPRPGSNFYLFSAGSGRVTVEIVAIY